MKKATYKGTISQDVKNFDLANINAYDWFSQFPKNVATKKESDLIKKLESVIKSSDAEKNYTFSDDRFIAIATNLIRLVPKEKYDFTISEYLIFYRYLEIKYDSSIKGIDNLIEFVNQMIGFSAEGGSISDEQKEILSETAESIEYEALRLCPLFIAEDIEDALKEDVEEVDMTGVEVLEKPTEKDLIDEMEEDEEDEEIISIFNDEEDEQEEKPEGEPSDISEWRETIAALQELIDENDSPESNAEWQETIETLKELITDSGYSFGYGGKVKRKHKPRYDEEGFEIDDDYSYADGGEIDEIRSEIEKQERKLNLASLPDSAKDAIRKKISELKGRLEKQEEKPKEEAKEEKGSMNDADIRSEIEKQERKLNLGSLPESAKDAIRKKIEQLKGQLSKEEKPAERKKKKIIIPRGDKNVPIVNEPVSKTKEKVIDKLEEIEEEDEESPIQKVLGKTKKAEEEIIEPKIPKKRGRKPKPKVEAEPKVPQKRGRKPKPKLSLSDFGLGSKFNINDFI
jgi:hypothetical protein